MRPVKHDINVRIETERLKVRPVAGEDLDELATIWLDPENARLRSGATKEQVRLWVRDAWGVWEKSTSELVGDCTLFFAAEHRAWELAYGLRRDRWGLGYATEAVQACVRYGFEHLGLYRIVADVDPGNVASVRVLVKCGFGLVDGTADHPVYVITRPQSHA